MILRWSKQFDVAQKVIWCRQKLVDVARKSVSCKQKKSYVAQKSISSRQKQDDAASKSYFARKSYYFFPERRAISLIIFENFKGF